MSDLARRIRQGRHADGLTALQASVRLSAGAVDADLARTDQLMQLALGQVGPAAAEPAIQAHPALSGVDDHVADLTHQANLRMSIRPANRAATDASTETRTEARASP